MTYDGSGNVIPLSERFNQEEKDILSFRKATTFATVKEVIPQGVIVHIGKHKEGSNEFDSAVITAPITLDGRLCYMGIAVKQSDRNDISYCIHDAVYIKRSPLLTRAGPHSKVPLVRLAGILYFIILSTIVKYNTVENDSEDLTDHNSLRTESELSNREVLGEAMKEVVRGGVVFLCLGGREKREYATTPPARYAWAA